MLVRLCDVIINRRCSSLPQEERWGTLDAKKKKRQRIAAQEIALLEGGTIDEQAERNGEKNEEVRCKTY